MLEMTQHIFIEAGRYITATIFLVAGWAKLKAGVPWMTDMLRKYGVLNLRRARLIARLLPPFEITIGLFLLFGLFVDIAIVVGYALLVLFTIILCYGYIQNTELNCGCFGRISKNKHAAEISIYRNITVMMILVALLYRYPFLDSVLINKDIQQQEINRNLMIIMEMIIALLFLIITTIIGRKYMTLRSADG
jgi:uncharacterized membrane protein YphA (DoxX/SURF4 family)